MGQLRKDFNTQTNFYCEESLENQKHSTITEQWDLNNKDLYSETSNGKAESSDSEFLTRRRDSMELTAETRGVWNHKRHSVHNDSGPQRL